MNETQIIEYLRRIIQVTQFDKIKEGTKSDWESWLDPTKLRDRSLSDFVKLLIRLEVLIETENNNARYELHNQSRYIARDYLENNMQVFQTLDLLYDINRSKQKKTN